jgi:hypothetical protein
MKFVTVVNERVGCSHVVCMFPVGVFPHFSKKFLSLFHRTAHVAYSPLDVTIMGPFQAKYGAALIDRMMANPREGGGGRYP